MPNDKENPEYKCKMCDVRTGKQYPDSGVNHVLDDPEGYPFTAICAVI